MVFKWGGHGNAASAGRDVEERGIGRIGHARIVFLRKSAVQFDLDAFMVPMAFANLCAEVAEKEGLGIEIGYKAVARIEFGAHDRKYACVLEESVPLLACGLHDLGQLKYQSSDRDIFELCEKRSDFLDENWRFAIIVQTVTIHAGCVGKDKYRIVQICGHNHSPLRELKQFRIEALE